jgi:Flp pilus assembly protein TadG
MRMIMQSYSQTSKPLGICVDHTEKDLFMKKISQSKSKENGQSMVELALTITFLMILLAGTVDLGRAFFTWLAMRDAAQEGATYGSLKPGDTAGIQARVLDNLVNVINNPVGKVFVSVSTTACPSHNIQVDVDYPSFPITMPFLGTLLGSQQIPIHATINDTIIIPNCP